MSTLKNLALALVNATLILVALCLVLALLISQSAERAADQFSAAVSSLAPIRSEIATLGEEAEGLRADIQTLANRPGPLTDEAKDDLSVRIDILNARLASLDAQFTTLDQIPQRVTTTAIDHIADRAIDVVNAYQSCTAEDQA